MPDDEKEVTTHAEGFQRHEQRSDNWHEAQAVTGRPNDTPIENPQPAPLGGNSTLADRAKARQKDEKKIASDEAEDKAVTSASTKSKRARKS